MAPDGARDGDGRQRWDLVAILDVLARAPESASGSGQGAGRPAMGTLPNAEEKANTLRTSTLRDGSAPLRDGGATLRQDDAPLLDDGAPLRYATAAPRYAMCVFSVLMRVTQINSGGLFIFLRGKID